MLRQDAAIADGPDLRDRDRVPHNEGSAMRLAGTAGILPLMASTT
jgi:hypothetical protein